MRKGLFLFVFLISMGLHAQQYTVHRNQFVYEIKDSTGRSVYQCFADTVMLMYKNKYAYIVKGEKIGLYAVEIDSLLLPPVYNEIWINYERNRTKYMSAYPVTQVKSITATKIEFVQKGRRIADIIDNGYCKSIIKAESYLGKPYLIFYENYNKDITEPYYRILSDGTRLDSMYFDENGNIWIDANGNTAYVYPPNDCNHVDFMWDLSTGKFIRKNGLLPWIENNHLIWSNESVLQVCTEGFEMDYELSTKYIFTNKRYFQLLFDVIFSTDVKPQTYGKDSIPVIATKWDEWDRNKREFITVRKGNNYGIYNIHAQPPFYSIYIPCLFEYANYKMVVSADSSGWIVGGRWNEFVEDNMHAETFYKRTLNNMSLTQCVSEVTQAVFHHEYACLFGYQKIDSLLVVNTFQFSHSADLKMNRESGVLDRSQNTWLLQPKYSMIIPYKDFFIVYYIELVNNKATKLESGIFDGTKWKIPMAEQFLLEEKGVLYKVVNGKKIPVTTK